MTQERLLQFLYQTPIGIIEVRPGGDIGLMNAYATRYLVPIAPSGRVENLFEILSPFLPALEHEVAAFTEDVGTVVSNRRFNVPFGTGVVVTLSLSIERLERDLYMATLADETELAQQEARVREARDDEAEQRGRSEIASSVLHDIGNAITGVSTTVARLLSEGEWPETKELQRLVELVRAEQTALSDALGQERYDALLSFLEELIRKLNERREGLDASYHSMASVLSHISETLSLQRQYAAEWVSGHRPQVALQKIVADARAMQQSGFEKRGIAVEGPHGRDLVIVEGDRTKLVRVFVNILKNAAEAFDRDPGDRTDAIPAEGRRITISLERSSGAYAKVVVQDNGAGFEAACGQDVTEEGSTTKASSRGIGLYAAKRIIEGHGGHLTLESDGPGCGARAVVELPLRQADGQQEQSG
jgi:signal transduction histidine kinase